MSPYVSPILFARVTAPLTRSLLVVALAVAALPACGDDDGDRSDSPGDTTTSGTGDAGDGDGNGDAPALFGVCAAIFNIADGSQEPFLALVPSLDSEVEVDLADTIPVNGLCSAPGGTGEFFVGLAESPIVEKWVIGDDDIPERVDQLSFANFGVAAASGLSPFVYISPTKAYYLDGLNLQVIVWNPQSMTITGSFPLEVNQEGLTTFAGFWAIDGDRLVLTAPYRRMSDSAAEPKTYAAFIDLDTDEVTYAFDDRCAIRWLAQSDNGDMYMASHTAQAVSIRGGTAGTPISPPCMTRIKSGATEFDSTYYVDLDELTGNSLAGAVLPGTGGFGYILVFDESLVPITEETLPQANFLPGWKYYQIRFGDEAATYKEVSTIPPAAGYGLGTVVEGTPYTMTVQSDLAGGQFYDISNPDQIQPSLAIPGFPLNAFRLR